MPEIFKPSAPGTGFLVEKGGPFRAIDIDINYKWARANKAGLFELFWGSDIFINHIPVTKSIIFANILVWVILFVIE